MEECDDLGMGKLNFLIKSKKKTQRMYYENLIRGHNAHHIETIIGTN